MTNYTCTAERFKRDTRNHRMTIISDNGVHRHIRFKQPNTSAYYFDLNTWPGHLCISGDCGTYVFQRLHDMFEFFDHKTDRGINPDYWGQKLQSIERNGGFEEFSQSGFKTAIQDEMSDWHFADDDEKRHVTEMVRMDVLTDHDTKDDALRAAMQFEESGFSFSPDIYMDGGLTQYSFRFIWCCRAIAWGVRQYRLGGDPHTRMDKEMKRILEGAI